MLIGEIIQTLKTNKIFDDSLIIMTADHSWRQDPNPEYLSGAEICHVPLLIKFPQQAKAEAVDQRINLAEDLLTIIEQYRSPQTYLSRRETW